MTDNSDIPADKLTKAYIKLRAKRAEISARFKEEDGVLVRQQEILKNALLDYCETSDWEQMYGFIKEHDVPEFLDRRLNQTNVKQFLEENPDVLPKGMNIDTEYVISVRKK